MDKEDGKALKIVDSGLGKIATNLFESLLSTEPEKADALIYLQGDRLDRADKAIEIYKKRFINRIVLTGNNLLTGPGKRYRENDISLEEIRLYLLNKGVLKKDIDIDDKSMNTLDQAKRTILLAKKQGWKKFLLLTSKYHFLRAYLTFLKQLADKKWDGKIIIVGPDIGWKKIPSGRKSQSLEMLKTEIDKIKKYKKDLVSIKQGWVYLNRQLAKETAKASGKKTPMRIVFYGGRQSGLISLLSLLALKEKIVCVVPVDETVEKPARFLGLKIEKPKDINGKNFAGKISKLKPDLFFCCHGRQILKKPFLDFFYNKKGAVNLHPCLFKYPGKEPIKRLLADKGKIASVASHFMTEKIDNGELILEEFISVSGDNEAEIYNHLYPLYSLATFKTVSFLRKKGSRRRKK